jgi:hypothetical protein
MQFVPPVPHHRPLTFYGTDESECTRNITANQMYEFSKYRQNAASEPIAWGRALFEGKTTELVKNFFTI